MNKQNFEWFEGMIDQVLKPSGKYAEFGLANLSELVKWTKPECQKIEDYLKNDLLNSVDGDRRSIVTNYCNLITGFINKIYNNTNAAQGVNEQLTKVNEAILFNLSSLYTSVSNEYSEILGGSQQVPQNTIDDFVTQNYSRLDEIRILASKLNEQDRALFDVVINVLTEFFVKAAAAIPVTVKQLSFIVHIIELFGNHHNSDAESNSGESAYELYLKVNINDQHGISVLKSVTDIQLLQINLEENPSLLLRNLIKTYNGMITDNQYAFDDFNRSLKSWLLEYLSNELDYADHKFKAEKTVGHWNDTTLKGSLAKVLCHLSTDQLSLIIRAADDSHVISGKSLNMIFKTIVPFLSTEKKENISWESMRVKSYTGEDRDKEIAISALEKMIQHIREY
ncbi:hypothetical protein SAMN05216464_113130 [Mucilaginibacter pineti]|uniref:Uncharacterized protein n=1 Tax=Mucilaginibacter pineti TaxID=1391627 RepID=A0A1G7IR30_9SPHI|nr:hypothetical protein [Mucilaginibacter pineti]SDF15147.1 hypothetical protein SAMN05216464_113130 [Mucilaginibacter pineti]